MSVSFHLPINNVSFGQVSYCLLREAYKRGLEPPIFLIGQAPDFSAQKKNDKFHKWIEYHASTALERHSRSDEVLKLWHINGSMESFSEKQSLFTFYEVDQPTKTELNILRNNENVIVSSTYAKNTFEEHGIKTNLIRIGFDKESFSKLDKQFFDDGRIVFNLAGKFEKRKHHEKIIGSWVKKYGNNKKYYLNCAIYNNFLKPDQNAQLFDRCLKGKKYYNVNFLAFMATNELYNDFLNCGDIIIGMSGGEGWGLPEFQSVGIGKHAVIMNAHSYKEWANEENSILVSPSSKVPVYDGLFFGEGTPYNQGNIFDFNEDDFLSACDEAIKRAESNPINESGLKIQEEYNYSKTFDSLLDVVQKNDAPKNSPDLALQV